MFYPPPPPPAFPVQLSSNPESLSPLSLSLSLSLELPRPCKNPSRPQFAHQNKSTGHIQRDEETRWKIREMGFASIFCNMRLRRRKNVGVQNVRCKCILLHIGDISLATNRRLPYLERIFGHNCIHHTISKVSFWGAIWVNLVRPWEKCISCCIHANISKLIKWEMLMGLFLGLKWAHLIGHYGLPTWIKAHNYRLTLFPKLLNLRQVSLKLPSPPPLTLFI